MKSGARLTRTTATPGHLGALDVVVDARERDRELVVGVADVGEVRVHPGQRLRLDLDVEVPFLWLGFHAVLLVRSIEAESSRSRPALAVA